MQKDNLKKRIDDLVEEIYTPDQKDIDNKFIAVLEAIENDMNTSLLADKIQDINQVLLKIQSAYVIKDYVTLADVLLYEMKEKLK